MKNIASLSVQAKGFIPKHYFLKVMKVSAEHSYDNEYGEGHYDLSAGDAKLEGTRGEHWSPAWKKIVSKYLLENGNTIDPDALPFDTWVTIQTNPDREIRKKNIVWMLPADAVSAEPFTLCGLNFDPAVDVVCMGGDESGPNLDWGCWPIKKVIFEDTYEAL